MVQRDSLHAANTRQRGEASQLSFGNADTNGVCQAQKSSGHLSAGCLQRPLKNGVLGLDLDRPASGTGRQSGEGQFRSSSCHRGSHRVTLKEEVYRDALVQSAISAGYRLRGQTRNPVRAAQDTQEYHPQEELFRFHKDEGIVPFRNSRQSAATELVGSTR